MKTFDYSKLQDYKWDNEIVAYLAAIHEYRGKQELFLRQRPIELKRLTEIAKIQSTENSNRIEGIVTTNSRLMKLIADKTTPINRSEEEILGYRNVLNLVHESYRSIPIKSNYILQLHRDLLQFTAYSYGGSFKSVQNEICMETGKGERIVLFKPLAPCETPDAVKSLCDNMQMALDEGIVDSLILIPFFILDFLCIHPFNDGNGRMSRLLTLLLLYRNDYMVGQYISIEKAISDTKEAYYSALYESGIGWHDGTNDPMPFVKYMLGVILKCYRDFESRMTLVYDVNRKGSSYDTVRAYALRTIGTFSKNDALENCPSIGSSSVEAALKKLADEKTIIRLGSGKNTRYAKNEDRKI